MELNQQNKFYDDAVVKLFIYATLTWGAVAFSVGLIAAIQLAYWPLNMDLPWLTFGRIRPLHTNAAIFAFAGNAIFAGIYHSTQRLCRTRLFSDLLSKLHFWGWQLIIISAAITLPLGFTQGKEYAELEWPIDIAITVVWVIFAVNFFGTLWKRKEKHLYVALWFYIATIITVAMLHIFNSLVIPVSLFKSYPIYAGIQDALVQWWYGHNAVAFFLTTPFLGLMYYYLPKAVDKPIYSYKLSIVHFWSLIFIYIWAGPHHLLYTSLPDWAQTVGMVFSVMLWAPSWGGMINGILTLRMAWEKLRDEPLPKFWLAAMTFYGMSTFEGPLLSIKSVSALGHYTDWIVGHVHSGTLGWNGLVTFAMIYWLVPNLWRTKLYSNKLATAHFWLALMGTVLYYTSMVAAGITQALMLRAMDDKGQLVYPDFIETVMRIIPLYWVRTLGGTLFITGFFIMLYNIYKTIKLSKGLENEEIATKPYYNNTSPESGHRKLEGLSFTFTVLVVIAVAAGGLIEIIPTLSIHKYISPEVTVRPYTPLELAGRDIYIAEGCYLCHSQQIRQLPEDVLRYGKASTIAESMYNRPFQWGSKRTGPDLSRVGLKYPNLWHYRHMMDPRKVVQNSIMPNYPWLFRDKIDFYGLRKKVQVLSNLGVPYTAEQLKNGDILAEEQAKVIAAELKEQGAADGLQDKKIVALIAYLQSLGQTASQSAQ